MSMSEFSNVDATRREPHIPGVSNTEREAFILPPNNGEYEATEATEDREYREYQENQIHPPNDEEREETIATISAHTNINSLLLQRNIKIERFLPYVGRKLYIKLTNVCVPIEDTKWFKNLKEATDLIEETVLNEMQSNDEVINLQAISIDRKSVARAISEAIIKSIQNRYDYEQWTQTDPQEGKNFRFLEIVVQYPYIQSRNGKN